jgi:hypothetical protein
MIKLAGKVTLPDGRELVFTAEVDPDAGQPVWGWAASLDGQPCQIEAEFDIADDPDDVNQRAGLEPA